LIALSATLLLAPAAQAQTPLAPGEIARVADQPITQPQYEHWRVVAQSSAAGKFTDAPDDDADVRPQVMQLLISFKWIEGEAARFRIVVRPGAVYTHYKRQKEQSFPKEEDFQAFLASSGQTVADIKLRVRLDLLANRVRDHVVRNAKTPKGEQRLLTRFIKRFTKRWKAKTICGQGYEIDDCGSVVPLST
jgi:hypothetical protein